MTCNSLTLADNQLWEPMAPWLALFQVGRAYGTGEGLFWRHSENVEIGLVERSVDVALVGNSQFIVNAVPGIDAVVRRTFVKKKQAVFEVAQII